MRPCNPIKSSAVHDSIKHAPSCAHAALVTARLYKTDLSTTEKQTHSHTHTHSQYGTPDHCQRSYTTNIERGDIQYSGECVSACSVGYLITSKTRHIQTRAGRPGPPRPPGERRDTDSVSRRLTDGKLGSRLATPSTPVPASPTASKKRPEKSALFSLQIRFRLYIGLV